MTDEIRDKWVRGYDYDYTWVNNPSDEMFLFISDKISTSVIGMVSKQIMSGTWGTKFQIAAEIRTQEL